jgi:hypothetical protein
VDRRPAKAQADRHYRRARGMNRRPARRTPFRGLPRGDRAHHTSAVTGGTRRDGRGHAPAPRAQHDRRVRRRQHPWQHPDCPMRPWRPRAGTVRTIWRGTDGYDTPVTRLRAWSRLTGWRFESSSAHQKALPRRAFFV